MGPALVSVSLSSPDETCLAAYRFGISLRQRLRAARHATQGFSIGPSSMRSRRDVVSCCAAMRSSRRRWSAASTASGRRRGASRDAASALTAILARHLSNSRSRRALQARQSTSRARRSSSVTLVRVEHVQRQIDATVVRVLAQVAQHLALSDADADPIRGRAAASSSGGGATSCAAISSVDRAAAARAVRAQLAACSSTSCAPDPCPLRRAVRAAWRTTARSPRTVAQQARRRMLRAAVDEPIDLAAPPLQARVRDVVIGALRGLADLRIDDVQRAAAARACPRARTAARSSASSRAARRGSPASRRATPRGRPQPCDSSDCLAGGGSGTAANKS